MARVTAAAACLLVALGLSAGGAWGRPYAPRAGKAFHGGTGGYTERAIRRFGRRSGRRPAVYQYFFTPDWKRPSRSSLHWQEWLLRKTAWQGARAILHLSTARGGHGHSVVSPRGIALGQGDPYLLALGRLIADSRRVTYVRVMAEMNNFNNPYCAVTASGSLRGPYHSPRAYRQAWRRSALILRGGRTARINRRLRRLHLPRVRTTSPYLARPRVALMWNPFTAGLPDVARNGPGAYWPGRRYVDWVGTDLFANSPNFRGLNRFYWDRRWRRKPFMLGEWALWGREDRGFVRHLFGWIRGHRRLRMEVYNQGAQFPWFLRLSSFPRSARVLRRRVRSRRFAAYPPELRHVRRRTPPRHEPAPPPGEVPPADEISPPAGSPPSGGGGQSPGLIPPLPGVLPR
ncbi:MAG: hypothetical protein ABR581_07315 [Thermoleophilaceae bacterium]